MKHNTQTNEVLMYLQENEGITSMEAFKKFGATRLSAIIFTLRHQGYKISSTPKKIKNKYGGTAVVSVYSLEK